MEVEASEDILLQIFNQIDEDGNKQIERAELVNFLASGEFNLDGVRIREKHPDSHVQRS